MNTVEKKRKPRLSRPAENPPKRQKLNKDAPETSAISTETPSRHNLTLHDWQTVFAYCDLQQKPLNQTAVARFFREKTKDRLIFDQSTLSRKLHERATLEARATSFPNALSSRRERVVTRPDIEHELSLWVGHMHDKRELVNSPMLIAKRQWFEEQLNIPESERLHGKGWIASFCKAHKLKKIRRHGEGGSVDLAAVEAERVRIRELLAPFAVKDRWNVDETALFPFAPPDRGLAKEQMSGKKANKFRITLLFGCNADGSEKMPVFYIGKYKKPLCFEKVGPNERGFYYRNNKKAWMTRDLFQEWIKRWDVELRAKNQKIALTLDNFSGHEIIYEPKNITLIFFAPNMTSHIQPLDAGIIRCFKAIFRREQCLRAIELDKLEEPDIYKMNLLESMELIRDAWNGVSQKTIKACWDHTEIQREPIPRIVLCRPVVTTTSVYSLGTSKGESSSLITEIMRTEQGVEAENALLAHVKELKERQRIDGEPLGLDDLLDPVEECEIGDEDQFLGTDIEIVANVRAEIAGPIEIVEVESDVEEDDPPPAIATADMIQMSRDLEHACILHEGVNGA